MQFSILEDDSRSESIIRRLHSGAPAYIARETESYRLAHNWENEPEAALKLSI
jgi:hypothetical protein